MRTLVLMQPHEFQSSEREAPAPPEAHEALIKIRRIGICGTDYHAFRGRQPFFNYPRVLGHELSGEIAALGAEASGLSIGDQVAIEPYLNCGQCPPCLNGKSNCCETLQVLGVHIDGGMAEYIKVPWRKLHPSKTLSLEQLAIVEPLSIGAHAVQRAEVSAQDLVLVIGAGPIGLSVVQFAKLKGATVAVLDLNPARLHFAQRHLKADIVIDGSGDVSPEALKALLNGSWPTIVFDATGNPHSMKNAFQYVAFGGKIVFAGLFNGDASFDDPLFHRREMTLLASRNSLPQDFSNIIRLMEAGRIDVRPWLTHRADFDALPAAFNEWLQPETGVVKAMVSL